MVKFKKGNVIVRVDVERVIVSVFKNHYLWKYPESDNIFDSRNSNDPLFELGWKLKNE